MEGFEPNMWAVLVAALAGFVVGGLWYSPPLLGNAWMREAGVTEEQVNGSNKAKIFTITFFALWIMSYCLEMFIGPAAQNTASGQSPWIMGAFYGFLTGFGWLFFAVVVLALFELRSVKYMLINGGYWIVTMTVMGTILGGWA